MVSRIFLSISLWLALSASAMAGVLVKVDLSSQHMRVFENGRHLYTWPVSTGREGYRTPRGQWTVYRMHRKYNSKTHNNASMPNAMFFHKGFAIHGSWATRSMGKYPASHGCVRVSPGNAKRLFNLAKKHGMRRTEVKVHW